jgi:hypothetical protein
VNSLCKSVSAFPIRTTRAILTLGIIDPFLVGTPEDFLPENEGAHFVFSQSSKHILVRNRRPAPRVALGRLVRPFRRRGHCKDGIHDLPTRSHPREHRRTRQGLTRSREDAKQSCRLRGLRGFARAMLGEYGDHLPFLFRRTVLFAPTELSHIGRGKGRHFRGARFAVAFSKGLMEKNSSHRYPQS